MQERKKLTQQHLKIWTWDSPKMMMLCILMAQVRLVTSLC